MIRKTKYRFLRDKRGDNAQMKEIERDYNLKKSHHAPAYRYRSVLAYRNGGRHHAAARPRTTKSRRWMIISGDRNAQLR
jgi:hypothetical protein